MGSYAKSNAARISNICERSRTRSRQKDSASLYQDIRDAVVRVQPWMTASLRSVCAIGFVGAVRAEEEARRGDQFRALAPPELKSSERLDDRLSRIRAVSERSGALAMPEKSRAQAKWVLGR